MSEITTKELLAAIDELLPEFEPAGTTERLRGGNINVVWRIDGEPYRLIAKHAPPHIVNNPDVPLSSERIAFEAKALSLFISGRQLESVANKSIRPPKLFAFDLDRSLLLMEDVGSFKELYRVDKQIAVSAKTGERLGRFIGNLHRKTFLDDELQYSFANLEIQKVRHQLQYEPAHKYGNWDDLSTKNKIKRRSRDLGERLQNTGTCLVMGDLWPQSVFVNDASDIRLIDWEFVHFGRPLQDIGHFAAHCWMQRQTAQNKTAAGWWDDLWASFIAAYKDATGKSYEQLFNSDEKSNIGIHIGTEILIRSFGPFKDGYVFEPFKEGQMALNDAQKAAANFICDPQSSVKYFDF